MLTQEACQECLGWWQVTLTFFQGPTPQNSTSLWYKPVHWCILSSVHQFDTGSLHSERRGGIATAPPLRRSYSDRAVTSPGGTFQTDTNLANHRHRPKLLADCQWCWRWRCELGRLWNTRSLTKTIPRDRRTLIKLMLRKWTFLPPHSHLIRQFVKQHLVTIQREHVLAQWLRQ